MRLFKKKQPKYKVGDWVCFVGCLDLIRKGEIWDVKVSRFHKPIYQINDHRYEYNEIGENFKVSEAKIIKKATPKDKELI